MLELRPNCECCDKDLPPQADALICTYECTFCRDCGENVLKGICPKLRREPGDTPDSSNGEAVDGSRLDGSPSESRRLLEPLARLTGIRSSSCPTMCAPFAT